mmetsp:Transcript_33645/g.81546  ORF Transcript_33645/g.81546 Transcript_33645/m.81546 type:complete len:309 (+) Transcript_33645:160-1086(+)
MPYPSRQKKISSAAFQTSSSVAHVLEHLLSPPSTLQSSASLEDLTNVRIPSLKESGVEILAHVATPSNWDDEQKSNGDLKVVIMIHEFFGLTDSIVDKANGLAEELDCMVIAPDTFRGTTTTFIPKAIWLALSTPQDRVNDDLDAICSYVESGNLADSRTASKGGGSDAAAEAKESSPSGSKTTCKFAILGFCYGGGKAIRYTTQRRRDAATVVFYGMPVTDTQELQNLEAPVCGIYGRNDVQFPIPLLEEFQSALTKAQVEKNVKIYDGVGHAFWKNMEEVRRGDQPQQQAFQQCTNFLRDFFEADS